MGPFLANLVDQWPFVAALVGSCLVGAWLRNDRLAGTALVLLLNWSVCSAYVAQTGDPYPWTMFAAADYVAGFVVLVMLRRPPTLWQAGVGLIYAGMLVAHGARGVIGSPAAIYYGWYFLNYAAWAQVGLVGTWGIYELAGRHGMSVRRASPRHDRPGRGGTGHASR